MGKLWLLLLCGMIFAGCGAEQTLETVVDEPVVQVLAEPREIFVALPDDSVLPAMESDGRTLYLCRGYDVAVQTFSSGDINATVQQLCGFDSSELTILETMSGENRCYDFVWTAATDLGEQVGRAKILDDGDFHYSLTAMAPAEKASEYQEIWSGMFETFGIG